MIILPEFRRACFGALMVLGLSCPVAAQTLSVSPGALRTYSTLYSIGAEWDVSGDGNHNASAQVEYRVAGTSSWKPSLPLVRIDFNGGNMLAGSVMFLAPDTSYDLRLSLADPDGGGETRLVSIRTRPVPVAPVDGRIFHVVPGAGGGDGSPESPFGGVAAAEAVAQPGDTFLLHAGAYGGRVRFSRAGTGTAYLAWRAAGDGEVRMNGIDVAASYLWLEGLSIRNEPYAVLSFDSPVGVVITSCTLDANHYGIYLQGAGRDWYIADNTIRGDTRAASESLDGEGIDLHLTSGHTVAHNRISNVADGVSYPDVNVDIFGNDIFDTSDDGIEADNGRANVRIWGNRIHNAVHNGISFQPQSGGPWYIVRNQIAGNKEAAFKFRTTDRFVLLHNTIVNWGTAWPGTSMMCCNEDHLLRAYARNNLWVSVQGGQIWGFDAGTRDWRTDLDYDGFDWGSASNPFEYGGVTYSTLLGLSNASGLEVNGVRVWKESCFEQFDVPGPAPTPVPAQVMALQAGCPAVDAGVALSGFNDGFSGGAPDLGAHEYGRPPTTYGPRAALQPPLAPSLLATTVVSSTRVDLRWSDQASSETGFRVERAVGGQSFALLATVGANVVTYSDLGVTAGAQYAYRVAAYNAAGTSAYSNVASVTTSTGSTPYGGTPAALPGTVQIENFDEGPSGVAYLDTTAGNKDGQYRATDVDIESTTDTGGGYDVSRTRPGEWLKYSVSLASAGTYVLDVRVANVGTGARFHVEIDGVDATGAVAVPNTGGWQTWQTVTKTGLVIPAGAHVIRLVFDAGTTANGGVGNYNWLRLTTAGPASTPYGGTPAALPGTVQIENFDEGPSGVAYLDTTAGNKDGQYRATDVDIESTTDTGGGYDVSRTRPGEWLEYSVSVASAGTYVLDVRVANVGTGARFHVEIDGVDATGAVAVPNTGGWQTWQTVTKTGLVIPAGAHVIRLVFDAGTTANGGVGNYNWLRLTTAGPASTPYGGTQAALPGTVQIENFDEGGSGVAYLDTTAGNKDGQYRATDVDIESTTDTGGGYDVDRTRPGEWLKYSVSVAATGTYSLEVRIANVGTGARFHVEIDGVDRTGAMNVPNTGGWQVWQTVMKTGLSLTAGAHVVRLVFDAGTPENGGCGNFNWMRLLAS